MKTFAGLLLFFALGGLGIALVILATNGFHQAKSMSEAMSYAVIPTLIGIIALSGVTIAMAVDESRKEQVARLDKIAALLASKQ